jgi:hypothetical protein
MKRETIADCTAEQFLPAAYRLRRQFHAFHELIGMDRHREQLIEQAKADKTQAGAAFLEAMLCEMMEKHPAETVQMAASAAFTTPDQLAPADVLDILLTCLQSERVMDFFIRMELMAGGRTGGILQTLMLLRLTGSARNTSETASQSSTNGTPSESSAGDTSESA